MTWIFSTIPYICILGSVAYVYLGSVATRLASSTTKQSSMSLHELPVKESGSIERHAYADYIVVSSSSVSSIHVTEYTGVDANKNVQCDCISSKLFPHRKFRCLKEKICNNLAPGMIIHFVDLLLHPYLHLNQVYSSEMSAINRY